MYLVYKIICETPDKIYIGITKENPSTRLATHRCRTATPWTTLYGAKEMKILKTGLSKKRAMILEERTTLEHIQKYGIENVRGGSFCNAEIFPYQTRVLQDIDYLIDVLDAGVIPVRRHPAFKKYFSDLVCSFGSACYECGSLYHYKSECPKLGRKPLGADQCFICKKIGHWSSHCPTRKQCYID